MSNRKKPARKHPAKKPPGKDFEEAVFAFAKSLDPTAEVLFDHSVPDCQSGDPQQVDVWINAKMFGHFPVSVMVSCKDRGRRIDAQMLKAFLGELRSTSASMGVIYSRVGFTKQALEKARKNGVNCCRLYRNQPADLPNLIVLKSHLCAPRLGLELKNLAQWPFETWGELFQFHVDDERKPLKIASGIERAFNNLAMHSIETHQKEFIFPQELATSLRVVGPNLDATITIHCFWTKYVGKLEAHLVSGSYSALNQDFKGQWSMPMIDLRGSSPGPGWQEMTENPKVAGAGMLIVQSDVSGMEKMLMEQMGNQPLRANR